MCARGQARSAAPRGALPVSGTRSPTRCPGFLCFCSHVASASALLGTSLLCLNQGSSWPPRMSRRGFSSLAFFFFFLAVVLPISLSLSLPLPGFLLCAQRPDCARDLEPATGSVARTLLTSPGWYHNRRRRRVPGAGRAQPGLWAQSRKPARVRGDSRQPRSRARSRVLSAQRSDTLFLTDTTVVKTPRGRASR